jgi:hypothetical protein
MASAVGMTIVLTFLAVCAVVLWPKPVERVARTIKQSPGISWVVGFLTPVAFAVVVPALALLSGILVIACGLGLIGLMLIVVAAIGMGVAWAMGWIAAGQLIGERILTALGVRQITPGASAATGTAAITFLWLGLGAMSELFCIGVVSVLGWILFIVLGPIGLGAVILTRFGRQDYVPGQSVLAPVPPAPPTPPAPPVPATPEVPQSAPIDAGSSSAGLAAEPPLDKPADEL